MTVTQFGILIQMEQFTNEELNNIGIFLGRVDLKGTESVAHAVIMQKLQKMLQPVPEEKPKEEKKDEKA